MIRLFAALPVPAEISNLLVPLQRGLNGASWRPRDNFHITLRFFGDVTHDLASELDLRIADIPTGPITLALQGCGSFGKREPRAVWAKVSGNQALSSLSAECERIARQLGLPAEKKPFRPHVTLAYCHGTTADEAIDFETRNISLTAGPWIADRFHLYSSQLGVGPSRYVAETEYPLI